MFLLKKLKNLKQSSFLFHEKHQDTLDALAAGKLTDEIKSTIEGEISADLSQKYFK